MYATAAGWQLPQLTLVISHGAGTFAGFPPAPPRRLILSPVGVNTSGYGIDDAVQQRSAELSPPNPGRVRPGHTRPWFPSGPGR